jgi:hypothetical protein
MSSKEQEDQPSYLKVARFSGERPARRAYNQLQDAIFRSPACELSVFRLILDRQWHVSVLGDQPDETLERRIRQVLSRGVPASLPEEILAELQRRRAAATEIGPWVEGHYRSRGDTPE